MTLFNPNTHDFVTNFYTFFYRYSVASTTQQYVDLNGARIKYLSISENKFCNPILTFSSFSNLFITQHEQVKVKKQNRSLLAKKQHPYDTI